MFVYEGLCGEKQFGRWIAVVIIVMHSLGQPFKGYLTVILRTI
jgi:hypothetical protein